VRARCGPLPGSMERVAGEQTMEAIELLRTRYSASKLGAPAPSAGAVEADGYKSAIP
jgi:hypothetical protein